MVHYDHDPKHAAQTPPQICPKCGSHRTEVVGHSDDGRTITLRCNSCGERSNVLVDRRASDADEMTDEIEAIRAVGSALARLPDAGSRERVLRWAAERFQIEPTIAVPVATPSHVMASQVRVPDSTLSVDGLQEFFPVRARTDDALSVDAETCTQPLFETAQVEETPVLVHDETPKLDSMVHSFVADFQRLASDWQTVFAAPGSGSR